MSDLHAANAESTPQSRQFLGIDVRFLAFLRPDKLLLITACFFVILTALLAVVAPWPLKFIFDNVLGTQPYEDTFVAGIMNHFGGDKRSEAVFWGFALLVLTLLQGGAAFFYEYLNGLVQERAIFRLRNQIFSHVQHLPLAYYDRYRLGDTTKRITEDAGKVMAALVGSTSEYVVNALKFVGFGLVMLSVNWRFSIIVLTYVPLLLWLFRVFRLKIRATAREAREREGQIMNLTLETLGAIREVKAFGREAQQQAIFENHGRSLVRSMMQSVRWEASFGPLIDLVQAASIAAVVWFGVAQVLAGDFTVGELIIFMTYLRDMYRPLRKFSKIAAVVQKASASAFRLEKLLDKRQREPVAEVKKIPRARGLIEFRSVSFAYPNVKNRPVISEVTLKVPPGNVVALVGPTGAGKSTLSNLLLRFYEPRSGTLLLDNVPAEKIPLYAWRQQFALVPQESILWAASIRENIAFGRQNATDEQIIAAAQTANAHEFIQRLPDGYDTIVGERGSTLSGGQRQRIAIARAVLRDAPVLILDEPTAALDVASEALVMGALQRLMHRRTVFIIAHRLSTIRTADQIVVLNGGRIVEVGTHDELMRLNRHYARLVQLQNGKEALNEQSFKNRHFATRTFPEVANV